MGRSAVRVLMVTLAAALCLASGARADDTELFVKGSVPPNVLIILDSSQSMTWFNNSGGTVGDEFGGLGAQPASRMFIAKDVLNEVVTRYSDKINFGLAAYEQKQATDPANVKVTGPQPRSWYYAEGWSKIPWGWVSYVFGSRYYLAPWYFDLRVPQAGLGGPADPADPAGYDPATLRPNSPAFTVRWQLRTDVTPNPRREFWAGQAYIAPTSHNEDFCRYRSDRSYDGGATWTPSGSPWDIPPGGCPASGTVTASDTVGAVTISWTCTFSSRKTYDSPTPYVYSCTRYNNGSSIGTSTREYQDDQGASFSWTESFTAGYDRRTVSLGLITKPVTDSAGQAYRPDYYRWTYYYEATCPANSNCKNTGKFWQWTWSTPWYPDDATCKAGQVNDPWADPVSLGLPACGASGSWRNAGTQTWTPSATGAWGVPYDAEYRWQGNNYSLTTDTSCDGARILVDVGSGTQAEIKNYLGFGDNTKTIHAANRSTPIAGALTTAYNYFADPDGIVRTDALKECRRNYVLFVTDGGEACLLDLTVPGQKAADLANLNDPPGGVKTYVVGLDPGGLSRDENTVLGNVAAQGGTSDWYRASNRATLQSAIEGILGEILSSKYTFAAIIVPRMRFKDNLVAIQGSMLPNTVSNQPFWKGYLTAYKLDDDGTLATDGTNQIDASVVRYWEASAQLEATSPDDRKIYTLGMDTLDTDWTKWKYKFFEFKAGDLRVYHNVNCAWTFGGLGTSVNTVSFPDVDQSGGANTLADCAAFVNLLRGSDLHNWGSKLGDIFHSQPVVVGSPSPTYVDTTFDPSNPTKNFPFAGAGAVASTFDAFRGTKATRTRIAVVGANDGLLHAFNAGNWDAGNGAYDTGTGREVWAYLPPNLLGTVYNLGNKTGSHRYYADGNPKVVDLWLDDNNDGAKATDGSEWHTVLLMNLRQGGTGIFHLDLTDTLNPKPIANGTAYYPPSWSTCGQSWSEPAIGKVKMQIGGRKVDRWLAFFGDGDTSTNAVQSLGCGKAFYAVDLKTGEYVWVLHNKDWAWWRTNLPAELQEMKYDMVGSPIVLDTNADGYVDRVYIGDRGGQIWRFDVGALATSGGGDVVPGATTIEAGKIDNWVVSRLFVGTPTQSLYEKLGAAWDAKGNLWIFAGTGDRPNPTSLLDPADPEGAAGRGSNGRLYGIKDPYDPATAVPAPWSNGDLEDVTGKNTLTPEDLTKPGGWRFKLEASEKMFTSVELFNKQVFFATLKPGPVISGDGCSSSPSEARLYSMYYTTGGGATDGGAFTAAIPAPSANRYNILGSGAPTKTVISTLSLGGGGILYTGTNEGTVRRGRSTPQANELFLNAPNNLRFTRYWRQN